jgi:hypothetical protein
MRHEWKILCILFAVLFTACEAFGVPPQSTVPVQAKSSDIPTSMPGPIAFPQMTETALAVPTIIYPTERPPTPEELLEWSPVKTTSPDGNYIITCGFYFPTLFYASTKSILSSSAVSFVCDNDHMTWSSDGSFALLNGPGDLLYRWRTDGSQPEAIHMKVEPAPPGVECDTKFAWNPGKEYLAISKSCGLYVIKPDDESSFGKPLLVELCGGCFYDFRWATPRVLIVEYFKADAFVHVPSGNNLGSITTSGGICVEQMPLISPNERWMVFDFPWCGGGDIGPNQSAIANLEDGSEKIFSEAFVDRIDFVGWSRDGSELYVVSRPTELNALPDPRTPFGLLALDPETFQIQNLFEQAWFVSFDRDFHWVYVVFPAKGADGNSRLDGGLWQLGTSQLIGRQIMANALDEKFLEPVVYFGVQSVYSVHGQELGSSSTAVMRPIPAVWSHSNTQVALINSAHQLIVMNRNGDAKVVGQLNDHQEWLYSQIIWSEDDRSLDIDGTQWRVP